MNANLWFSNIVRDDGGCSTSLESAAWPIKRLAEKMVREGLVTLVVSDLSYQAFSRIIEAAIEGVVLALQHFG